MRIPLGVIFVTTALAISGCGSSGLRELQQPSTGPDEFMVMPAGQLTPPENYALLPTPTPGGSNLTDQNPQADAVVALGGNPAALNSGGGVPTSDGALVTASSRYGVQPDIRASLAAEDAAFRKRENRTARFKLFAVDRYEEAYDKETLNPFKINQWFRNSGYGTPSAPPGE
ncbi:DUF3035 domain-containing protein [Sedimentitalea sp. CY04]|uniref:DUF3035 domain-containing protein n=1 Tax=Parasedimentitalea denitrificans TaxID=2211118 RepID=A0ABX0W8F3_9RHOB|nr:DUF3035 domain-containing protein [Sedimentitalea sp. CY04]NIZ61919.1 DUF3035 domain-containing protein [Sedimentitalea sp. CY04]